MVGSIKLSITYIRDLAFLIVKITGYLINGPNVNSICKISCRFESIRIYVKIHFIINSLVQVKFIHVVNLCAKKPRILEKTLNSTDFESKPRFEQKLLKN